MKRYIRFDAEQFLKDSRSWSERIEELEQEKASITEVGGGGDGMPSGGGVSDPTAKIAMQRDVVQMKINKIYDYQTCFKYAWGCIGEDDKYILTGFFFAPGYVSQFVREWCRDNGSNAQYCYNARRKALERFGKACETWMELQG